MKALTSVFAALSLLAAAAGHTADMGDQTLTPLTDRPQAPHFDLEDANGDRVSLTDFAGKPLIINFWATWCPPCREEMPSMQRAWEQLAPNGVGLVAINVGEDADTIFQFMADYPVEFPLPMDVDSKVVQAYPVKGLPTTFVVDAEGRLAYRAVGGRAWDDPQLLDTVRALVPERE